MFKPISFSCQIEEGLLQEKKFFVSARMQRAQFVKVLSSSQELMNLSSKLPGEVEKDYLQFTDVEAKHRRLKWLVSGHVQGTPGCRGTYWFGAGTKESGPMSFFTAFSQVGKTPSLDLCLLKVLGKFLWTPEPLISPARCLSNGVDGSH